jgi:hypothetical protein
MNHITQNIRYHAPVTQPFVPQPVHLCCICEMVHIIQRVIWVLDAAILLPLLCIMLVFIHVMIHNAVLYAHCHSYLPCCGRLHHHPQPVQPVYQQGQNYYPQAYSYTHMAIYIRPPSPAYYRPPIHPTHPAASYANFGHGHNSLVSSRWDIRSFINPTSAVFVRWFISFKELFEYWMLLFCCLC